MAFLSKLGETEDKLLVEHKGYTFVRHYISSDKTYWRCNHVIAGKRCAARLSTGAGICERGSHNHPVPVEMFT